jgi:hypothetical protein
LESGDSVGPSLEITTIYLNVRTHGNLFQKAFQPEYPSAAKAPSFLL